MANASKSPACSLAERLHKVASHERRLSRLKRDGAITATQFCTLVQQLLVEEGLVKPCGCPPVLAELLDCLVGAVDTGCLRHEEHVVFMNGQQDLALHMSSVDPVLTDQYGLSYRRSKVVAALRDAQLIAPDLVKGFQVLVCFNGHRDRRRAIVVDWAQARHIVATMKGSEDDIPPRQGDTTCR